MGKTFGEHWKETAKKRLIIMYSRDPKQGQIFLVSPLSPITLPMKIARGKRMKNENVTLKDGIKDGAKTVLFKLKHGPMLNFVLLGIPFFISVTVGAYQSMEKEYDRSVRLMLKPFYDTTGKMFTGERSNKGKLQTMGTKVGDLKALNQSAYTDAYLPCYFQMMQCGMPEATARWIAEGNWPDAEDWADVFTETELDAMVLWLETHTKFAK